MNQTHNKGYRPRAAGARFFFLPAYLPDLNSIEQVSPSSNTYSEKPPGAAKRPSGTGSPPSPSSSAPRNAKITTETQGMGLCNPYQSARWASRAQHDIAQRGENGDKGVAVVQAGEGRFQDWAKGVAGQPEGMGVDLSNQGFGGDAGNAPVLAKDESGDQHGFRAV